jgi:hypothetical protein
MRCLVTPEGQRKGLAVRGMDDEILSISHSLAYRPRREK